MTELERWNIIRENGRTFLYHFCEFQSVREYICDNYRSCLTGERRWACGKCHTKAPKEIEDAADIAQCHGTWDCDNSGQWHREVPRRYR